VENLVETSRSSIANAQVQSVGDVRRYPTRLIGYSSDLKSRNAALRRHLYERFYRHPEVHDTNENACRQMEAVFANLIKHPEQLGARTLSRMERDGLARGTADYVAGMTDSYLRSRYEALL
jgi:dGTPase